MSESGTPTDDPKEAYSLMIEKLRQQAKLNRNRNHQHQHPKAPLIPRAQDVSPELVAQLEAPDRLQRHLQAARIKLPARQIEAALVGKKWFDYRFMHPVDATQLFADEYAQLFQAGWKKYEGMEQAKWRRAFCGFNLFENDPSTVSGTWSARQKADELGMPYNFFIWHGLEFCRDGGFKKFPRPNQLLSEKVVAELLKRWRGAAAKNDMATSPQYLARNWQSHPLQEAYVRSLVQRPRSANYHSISHVVFQRGLITFDRAEAEFGKDAVNEAREWWEKLKGDLESFIPAPSEHPVDLRPGCFGVPGAFNITAEMCGVCPFSARCQVEQVAMQAILNEVYDSGDPHRDNERKKAAERQRQRRLRQKKAGKTS